MNMTKLGLALSLTAAFGLVACGDSSSNASSGNTASCDATFDDDGDEREDVANPYDVTGCSIDTSSAEQFFVKGTVDGVYMVGRVYMDDGFYVSETTLKDAPQTKIDEYCAKKKAEADEGEIVTCEGDVVTSKVEDPTGISYSMARAFAPMMCLLLGAQ